MTTATASLTIEQTDEARRGLPARWTVTLDGKIIGTIERYRKSATRDNAYEASFFAPDRALYPFNNFRGSNGLRDAAEAIAAKGSVGL